jgi:hypothetical protein
MTMIWSSKEQRSHFVEANDDINKRDDKKKPSFYVININANE